MGVGAGALEAWPQAGEFHTRSQPTNISSSQSGRRLPAESLPPHQAAALSQTDLPLTQGEAPQPLQLEPDPTPAQVTAKLKDFLGIRLHLPAKQQQQWGCSPEPSCPERFPRPRNPTPGGCQRRLAQEDMGPMKAKSIQLSLPMRPRQGRHGA